MRECLDEGVNDLFDGAFIVEGRPLSGAQAPREEKRSLKENSHTLLIDCPFVTIYVNISLAP